MSVIPYGEPPSIRAGDTIQWRRTLSEYPATSWTLTYSLLNAAGKITIAAGADGSDHLVSVAKATSALYTAGWYDWTASVSDGTSRYTVDNGRIRVFPDLAAATTYDARSHARIMLEAIEALIEGRATSNQLDLVSTVVSTRQLQRDPALLIKIHSRYAAMVRAEDDAARVANGETPARLIQTRFLG